MELAVSTEGVAPPNPSEMAYAPARPWQRFWARYLDLQLNCAVIVVVWAYFLPKSYSAVSGINQYIAVFLLPPPALALEALSLAVSGVTIGKAVTGIKLRDLRGERLSLSVAAKRTARVYFTGLALGVPFVSLFTMSNAYSRVNSGRLAAWDEACGTRPSRGNGNLARTIAAAVIGLGIIVGEVAISALAEKQQQAKTPIEQLAAGLSHVNSTLPKQIDDLTRLDSISTRGNSVVYKYTMMDRSGGAVNAKEVIAEFEKNHFRSTLKRHFCEANDFQFMRLHNISAVFSYYALDGTPAGQFEIQPSECTYG